MHIRNEWIYRGLSLAICLVTLAGCSSPAPQPVVSQEPPQATTAPAASPSPQAPTATASPAPTATPTALPTATEIPASPTASPTSTVVVTPTVTLTATVTARATASVGTTAAGILPLLSQAKNSGKTILLYYVQPGATGTDKNCSFTMAAVSSGTARDGDPVKDIGSALQILLSYKGEYFGGYYNPAYRANFAVRGVNLDSGSPMIWANLGGSYDRKNMCENHQLKSQVYMTAHQFPDAPDVNVYLNGSALGDFLSVLP